MTTYDSTYYDTDANFFNIASFFFFGGGGGGGGFSKLLAFAGSIFMIFYGLLITIIIKHNIQPVDN